MLMTSKDMKSIFIDCNDQLAPGQGHPPDDPPIFLNRTDRVSDDLPQVLDGYAIALDDHSYMPTNLVAQCPALKHRVPRHQCRELHERRGAGEPRHHRANHQRLWRTAVAEAHRPDVRGRARDVARMDRDVRSASGRRRKAYNCSARRWA
jgi:D-3-phosphoglycerate dehydrogenase